MAIYVYTYDKCKCHICAKCKQESAHIRHRRYMRLSSDKGWMLYHIADYTLPDANMTHVIGMAFRIVSFPMAYLARKHINRAMLC